MNNKRFIILAVSLLLVNAAAAAALCIAFSGLFGLYVDSSVPIVEREDSYEVPVMPDEQIISDGDYDGPPEEEDTAEITKPAEDLPEDSDIADNEVMSDNAVLSEEQLTEPKTEPERNTETVPPGSTAESDTAKAPSGSSSSSSVDEEQKHYDTYQEPKSIVPIYKKEQKNSDISNILLLGRDSRDSKNDRGRTDAMIILSYCISENSVKLISLQRDTLIPIEGHDWNRINTPYTFGGIGLCINTVNDIFDLDIQMYVIIDFDGVVDMVNQVGGLVLTLNQAEVDYYKRERSWDFTVGENLLNGDQVLAHARNRTVGNSDFSRPRRQRDVIAAMYERIIAMNDFQKTVLLINYGLTKVSTNIPIDTMIAFAGNVLASGGVESIESTVLPFDGTYESAWYKQKQILSIDIKANKELLQQLIYG